MLYGHDLNSGWMLRSFKGGCLRPLRPQEQLFVSSSNAGTPERVSDLHVLFVEEHNRIAEDLSSEFPECLDETLFHEARKRIIAMIQGLTIHEFLPKLLGPDRFEPFDGYQPDFMYEKNSLFSSTLRLTSLLGSIMNLQMDVFSVGPGYSRTLGFTIVQSGALCSRFAYNSEFS